MKRLFGWIISVVLTAGTAMSAFAGAGRNAALILDLPHRSVRATGIAEAFSAYEGDLNTLLWNPAGIATLPKRQVVGGWNSFADVFGDAGEGLYYALFSGGMPVKDMGVVAATLQLQGQGTIDVTTDSPEVIAQENLGTNWVMSVSYADTLTSALRAGITGKVIRLPLGVGFEQGTTATAYALDLGAQYDVMVFRPATFGLSVMNYGTRVQFKDENQSDPLPRKLHSGVAVNVLDGKNSRLTLSLEAVAAIDKLKQNESDEDFVETVELRMKLPENQGKSRSEIETQLKKDRGVGVYALGWDRLERSVGMEYVLSEMFAFRVGYKLLDPQSETDNIEAVDRVTAGFGINLGQIGVPIYLDYANGLWGGGGPLRKRVNTFALAAAF